MNICPQCGKDTFPGDNYCGGCGVDLSIHTQDNSMFTQQELNVNDIRYNLGVVYFKQGRYDIAMSNFKKVLDKNPDNKMAKKMLTRAHQAIEKNDDISSE